MNKTIEVEYYVDRVSWYEIKSSFLQLFDDHFLLKFISLHKRFNLTMEILCQAKVTRAKLEVKSHGRLIEFTHEDFKTHFGLEFRGMEVCSSNAPVFNIAEFVRMILKSLFKDHLDTSNFQINQIKCEMCMLHLVVIKILYMKPMNWARVDDLDLYLMWLLLTQKEENWLKFILDQINNRKSKLRRVLFYNFFIQYILELNEVCHNEADMLEASKLFDDTAINLIKFVVPPNLSIIQKLLSVILF